MDRSYYSDKYFVRAASILKSDGHDPAVLMQIFCRTPGVLCGIAESVSLLEGLVGDLEVAALADGDAIEAWETVMTISGSYAKFAYLETLILGVLARGTRVATQTKAIVGAANGKPVLFFGGRHDHYLTQEADGFAAIVGGASGVATDAQGHRSGQSGVGTVPHSLIAAYRGNTVMASKKFVEHIDTDVPFTALVDFDNDCVATSLDVARELGGRLHGVRLDTSGSLVDISLQGCDEAENGVNPTLVNKVRQALDEAGFQHVQIVVSGGLTETKVAMFEAEHAPVDAYGVGSAIVRNSGEFDFTADIVRVDGEDVSKVGRRHQPNARLRPI
ncbi:MAG: nicotinate phosphoribosyltransferase [Pseudomonadales bacterium]|nr:nicotinate phosphoribosyltransferase [Pseudomonadales bacterium]